MSSMHLVCIVEFWRGKDRINWESIDGKKLGFNRMMGGWV